VGVMSRAVPHDRFTRFYRGLQTFLPHRALNQSSQPPDVGTR
jgi:hypothetical protein